MYLSPYKSNESDEGTYFSYVPSNNRANNIRTCLPGGFSGSGSEYEMYKTNCLDLMAEQCTDQWGKECDLYVSNLDQKQSQLFKEMVDYRKNARSDYSKRNSCHRMSGIANGQVEVRGINPSVSGDMSYNKISHPQACPPATVEVMGSVDNTAERLMRQRYHQSLNDTEFPYSRAEIAAPVFRRERFQSEVIQKELQDKQKFQHEQSLKYEQKRANANDQQREMFQSEMNMGKIQKTREGYSSEWTPSRLEAHHYQTEPFQSEMNMGKIHKLSEPFQSEMNISKLQKARHESYVAEWNPMRLQAHHYQMESDLDVGGSVPKPDAFVTYQPKQALAFSPPADLPPSQTPIPFYPADDAPTGQQYPQPPNQFLPTLDKKFAPPQNLPASQTPMPFLPYQDKPMNPPVDGPAPFMPSEQKAPKTDVSKLVEKEVQLPVLIEDTEESTPISLLIPDSEQGNSQVNQEKEIGNILFGSDCGSSQCSIQKILQQ